MQAVGFLISAQPETTYSSKGVFGALCSCFPEFIYSIGIVYRDAPRFWSRCPSVHLKENRVLC